MSEFLSRFRTQAAALGISCENEEQVLLAVSGGVDSMVMLHLFHTLGIPCSVAHCNFQLRGDESDGDEAFVKDRAGEWSIPFFSKRFDTLNYTASAGVSVQVAARDLRYQWFAELCEQLDLTKIATAHHLNDHAETVLINWLRGSGIAGLSGIPAIGYRANGRLQVLRPLLTFTRNEILAYARENEISWREDSSNAKTDYTRNFIRQRIVPLLEEIQPGFLRTFEHSANYLAETSANYQYLLQQHADFQQIETGMLKMDIAALQQLPAPVSALRELLKDYGFTPEQARQVAIHLDKTGLDLVSDTGNRLIVDRGRLLLELASDIAAVPALAIMPNDLMIRLPDGSRLFFTDAATNVDFPDGKEAIIVDADQLQYPLQLRTWQAGDQFQPFGMKGKRRKIQDFLTDLKLSKPEKESTLMLINGNSEIIWVVGHRLDNRYKVEKSSGNWLKISWIKLT